MCAIKFYEDLYYTNEYYAQVGGVALAELNKLESEMLCMLEYNLHVAPEMYQQYVQQMTEHYCQVAAYRKIQQLEAELKVPCIAQASFGSVNTVPSNNELA